MTRRERIIAALRQRVRADLIARDEGVDVAYITKVAKQEGIDTTAARPGEKPMGDLESLGRLHEQIGRKLFHYRNVINHYTESDVSDRVRMSVTRIRKAESGLHEFTLSELVRIANLIGEPLETLIKETTVRFKENANG